MVRHVESLEEFNEILKGAGDKLVVVDFTASWCGPCKQIGPEFEKLSQLPENANVVFLKVDVDDAQDVAEKCEIQAMPTFMFFVNAVKVHEFRGASKATLIAALEQHRRPSSTDQSTRTNKE